MGTKYLGENIEGEIKIKNDLGTFTSDNLNSVLAELAGISGGGATSEKTWGTLCRYRPLPSGEYINLKLPSDWVKFRILFMDNDVREKTYADTMVEVTKAELTEFENYNSYGTGTEGIPIEINGCTVNLFKDTNEIRIYTDELDSFFLLSVKCNHQDIERLDSALPNSHFSSGTLNWTANTATASATNDYYKFTATASAGGFYSTVTHTQASGDKFYIAGLVKADSADVKLTCYTGNAYETMKAHSGNGEYEILSNIYTATSSTDGRFRIQDDRTTGWTEVEARHCVLINLTTLFGAGNEPTTADWCDRYLFSKFDEEYDNVFLNSAFNGTTNWAFVSYTVVSTADGILTLQVNNLSTTGQQIQQDRKSEFTGQDKYFWSIDIKPKDESTCKLYVATWLTPNTIHHADEWNTLYYRGTYPYTNAPLLNFSHYTNEGGYSIGDTFKVRRPTLVNLTATFGAGKEPDETWCINNLLPKMKYD